MRTLLKVLYKLHLSDKPKVNCCAMVLRALCVFNLITSIVGTVVFLFTFVAIAVANENSDLQYLEIGDILGNSSALIDWPYNTTSSITLSLNAEQRPYMYIVFLLESMSGPSTITDYLPLEQLASSLSAEPESEYRGAFNYLGSNEPIYLLSGSSITYSLIIASKNTTHSACLYLYTSETHYNNFLMSVNNSNVYNDSYCFVSANTTEPATATFSFNITSAKQYYVGIQLQSGVTVQANASVVQIYYNTTGLQQQTICSGITSCSINVCNTFLCSHEAITYILIKPSNRASINYFFTSPKFKSYDIIYFTLSETAYITLIIISGCFIYRRWYYKKTACKSTLLSTLCKKWQCKKQIRSINYQNETNSANVNYLRLESNSESNDDDDKSFVYNDVLSEFTSRNLDFSSSNNQMHLGIIKLL